MNEIIVYIQHTKLNLVLKITRLMKDELKIIILDIFIKNYFIILEFFKNKFRNLDVCFFLTTKWTKYFFGMKLRSKSSLSID